MPKGKRMQTPKQEKKKKKQAEGEAEAEAEAELELELEVVAEVEAEAEADASVEPRLSDEIAAEDPVEEQDNEAEDAEDDVEVLEGEEAQAVEDAVEETPRRRNKKRRRSFKRGKPVEEQDNEAEDAEDAVEVAEGEEAQAVEDAVEETPRRRNKKRRRSFKQDKPVATPTGSQREKKEVQIAGMIFMCNDVTKKDCFKYGVFGLPEEKKDLVQQVKKGTKLFLYNINQKHLYGIYQATSRSGMNLVPEAFRESDRKFPAQVRFRIHKDCVPLKESDFKEAIKDNYVNRGRFKPELSSEQVRNLMRLFRPLDPDGVPQPRNNRDARREPASWDTRREPASRDARRGPSRDSHARGSARGSRDWHARGSARHVPRPAPPEPIRHIPGPAPPEVVREPLYSREVTSLYARERPPVDSDYYRTQLGYISAASRIALAEAEGRQRYLDNLYLQQANLIASRPLLHDPLNRGAEYQREMPINSSYAGYYGVGWPY